MKTERREEPDRLEAPQSIENLLPRSPDEALLVAYAEHPTVEGALHQADAAEHGIKVAEGALLPTVSVNAQVNQQYDYLLGQPGTRLFTAQGLVSLNAPLY